MIAYAGPVLIDPHSMMSHSQMSLPRLTSTDRSARSGASSAPRKRAYSCSFSDKSCYLISMLPFLFKLAFCTILKLPSLNYIPLYYNQMSSLVPPVAKESSDDTPHKSNNQERAEKANAGSHPKSDNMSATTPQSTTRSLASTQAADSISSSENEKPDNSHDRDVEAECQQPPTVHPPYSIFTVNQKRGIVMMVGAAALLSPLSANIYFPAIPTLARQNHVSIEDINLTVTSYMIFQGLAPTILGDLADMAGRRPAYLLAFVIYLGANIGLALQHSYSALIALRYLQSSGSSGTVALANGVAADIAAPAERGMFMGMALAGPMVGPAIGPVLGGVLSKGLGGRSIFWFLTIAAGVCFAAFSILFPETGRNIVGNSSIPPQHWNMSLMT